MLLRLVYYTIDVPTYVSTCYVFIDESTGHTYKRIGTHGSYPIKAQIDKIRGDYAVCSDLHLYRVDSEDIARQINRTNEMIECTEKWYNDGYTIEMMPYICNDPFILEYEGKHNVLILTIACRNRGMVNLMFGLDEYGFVVNEDKVYVNGELIAHVGMFADKLKNKEIMLNANNYTLSYLQQRDVLM